jgi:septum formation protein
MSETNLVLASGSPRRKQLMEEMGLRFQVSPTDADETLPEGATPEQAVVELARRKAAAAKCNQDSVIIAADTLVAVDGRILGKPAGSTEAVEMLKLLRGRTHEVVTGLCVACSGRLYSSYERTLVRFDDMTDRDIEDYVSTGEPLDKAGAYGIQGSAGLFISGIEGCYFNVVGLPKAALRKLLMRAVGEEEYRAFTGRGALGREGGSSVALE